MMLLLFGVFCPVFARSAEVASVDIASTSPHYIVDPEFLGVNIDSASFTNNIDLTDSYLINMASQLSAASGHQTMHLRVGGSASNGVKYEPNGIPGRSSSGGTVFTDASLATLNEFATRANLRITFCIPYQTTNGKWDAAINATALWKMIGSVSLLDNGCMFRYFFDWISCCAHLLI